MKTKFKFDPYYGSSTEAINKTALHVTNAILDHLSEPPLNGHELVRQHPMDKLLDNVLSPEKLFERCKVIVMNHLWDATNSHDEMQRFAKRIYSLQFGSWLWASSKASN